jgi:hypothetical protein
VRTPAVSKLIVAPIEWPASVTGAVKCSSTAIRSSRWRFHDV